MSTSDEITHDTREITDESETSENNVDAEVY